MMEITDDFQYNMAKEELEDGVRLVLWAQDTKVGYSCGNKLCVCACIDLSTGGFTVT